MYTTSVKRKTLLTYIKQNFTTGARIGEGWEVQEKNEPATASK